MPNQHIKDRDLVERSDRGSNIHWTATLGIPLLYWCGPGSRIGWRNQHPSNWYIGDTMPYRCGPGWRIRHPWNWCIHIFSIFWHLIQTPVMGECLPCRLAPFTLHMMEWLLSSKNLTQTCIPHSWYQIHPPYWLPLQSDLQPKLQETVKYYTIIKRKNKIKNKITSSFVP